MGKATRARCEGFVGISPPAPRCSAHGRAALSQRAAFHDATIGRRRWLISRGHRNCEGLRAMRRCCSSISAGDISIGDLDLVRGLLRWSSCRPSQAQDTNYLIDHQPAQRLHQRAV
jgi:hypothetical protein